MARVFLVKTEYDNGESLEAFGSKTKAETHAKRVIEEEFENFGDADDLKEALRYFKSCGRYAHDQFDITLHELEIQ